MSERIYRDPVDNIIRLRTNTDEGELMMRLIDTHLPSLFSYNCFKGVRL